MATMVQGVEKEFLLKSFYNDQAPVVCRSNRMTYTLHIEKLGKTEISFKMDKGIQELTAGNKIDLIVDYNGVVVVFAVEVKSINDDCLITTFPDLLYKNLDRSYPRVTFPADMRARISFGTQERYFLPLSAYKEGASSQEIAPSDPGLKNFNDITASLASWVKESGGEHRLLLFKEAKPVSLEEQIIAKTGKALFLSSTKEPLPETDPGTKSQVIIKEQFLHYLEDIGILASYFDAAIEQFIHSKQAKNIFADLWVPLCFKNYVAGYIHFWVIQEDKAPLPATAVEALFGYANSMVAVLQEKNYFTSFNLKDKFVSIQGLDISAGGIRFSCPRSYISDMLVLNIEIILKLVTPKRTLTIRIKILRRYEEENTAYFGCQFQDIVPEDIRFLYEYIYGKPFTDPGGAFF